ncbi:MAG: ABC transporter ATP-binding protein [Candidatus Eisenbacteria bacterium]|uniref:ABC transporter ATP-binding protein n=1 Tax=Eiseniibacteriota bacterium TaxID=2212470 RepID=A0A933SG95_UNCEI|nr:ABC transporter ATP-binding protein [Candidatus Eisenbacteria bacterium]
MTALHIEDARKRFGAVEALRGLSFELRAGEMLALLGPNGAGKTTLVRALAGRVKLDGGRLALFGRDLAPGSARPELGVVPQELALYPLLTAGENLGVFGALHGLSGERLRARVAWALEWTGLGDRAKESVKHFSGGMKRRLNLACGVLHEPRVVLLDEPTVGVDPQSREKLYDMLAALRAAGAAVLVTTHYLEEAEARCERIVVMDHGRAVAQGTLAELVAVAGLPARRLTLHLERAAAAAPAGFSLGPDGTALTASVTDVAGELPALLERVRGAGLAVRDLDVRAASLQAAFLALTGKELRE